MVLLQGPSGQTLMTTIQKFQEDVASLTKGRRVQPLVESGNIIVLIDEAHRMEYGLFNARLRKVPPSACQIIVVMDKYLTGFDAPIVRVLYLNKPLQEHVRCRKEINNGDWWWTSVTHLSPDWMSRRARRRCAVAPAWNSWVVVNAIGTEVP